VPHINYEKLADDTAGEKIGEGTTEGYRSQRNTAAAIRRLSSGIQQRNDTTEVRNFCQTDASAQSLLKAAMTQMSLSARAFHRILKLARTIADLEKK
jgi:magnesium chelatase family protein